MSIQRVKPQPIGAPPWDFEDHTYIHQTLDQVNASDLVSQLQEMDALFAAHGLPEPLHFAYPEGVYTEQAVEVLSHYRLSCRLAGDGEVPTYPVNDWHLLGSISIGKETSVDDVKALIDQAVVEKVLLCLFTHDVDPDPTDYGCTPQMLEQILDYLVNTARCR